MASDANQAGADTRAGFLAKAVMKKWLWTMLALNGLLIGLSTWLLTRPSPHATEEAPRDHAAKSIRETDRASGNPSHVPITAQSVMAKPADKTGSDPTVASQPEPTIGAAAEKVLSLPASIALQSPDTPLITDQQVAEWEQLQDTFLAKVDSSMPSTDAAREAWDEAQRENDDLFRAKFGDKALQRQQMEAYKGDSGPGQQ